MKMVHYIIHAMLLMSWLGLAAAEADGVYYIAPDGNAEGTGSKDDPFPTAAVALTKVGGAQTLIFRPGIYPGPITVPLRCKGTPEHPTVLKSEEKWKAIVVGAKEHAIFNHDGCDWLVVDGFEVAGARSVGIKMNGDHNTVRNCYVHNNSLIGIAIYGKMGGIIENNLVEYNGSHPQFHHGIYASGDALVVRGNIVRHNAGLGLHLYPSLSNSIIANNLVYGQAQKPGVLVDCPLGGGHNRIVNNTIVSNAGGLLIWNGDGEIIVNNIIAKNGQSLVETNTKNTVVDYNLLDPKPDAMGSHNLVGDPKFVDSAKGVFWLRPNSPAIGAGTRQQAAGKDFWGRQQTQDKPMDLGCFPFVAALADPETVSHWHYGWPYRFAPEDDSLPDFWILPK